ncbi:PhzF family phenazine biosynthesis protein [Chryseosolibacter indicus]|uniref:PhzF family phenazine biosynthesis protein n=1 Tax=Chryseosolibacter indicus TaxID=2782351 RepID=A0ABS5VR95_9BACT|nr:PhzF family phenazine biosynthesis protein [Chryseosolibacter indicus]MBT1703866.1 PhzF family phenazine biosynthesis protein [Chryseosolibacter indicus]
MKLPFFHVDAFTDTLFRGNPAGVCILDKWLPTAVMQQIAAENFLPETAFFVPAGNDQFELKWFTPDIEMDLCGHATLATAHTIFNHLNNPSDKISFQTKGGILTVSRDGDLLTLDFPSRMPSPAMLPEVIEKGIGIKPVEVWKARDYVLVCENQKQIKDCKPDRSVLDQINLDPGGIIITAPGSEVDFVSRFFTTQSTIFEDPVTGSAHCSLIPLWSKKLGKKEMVALQLSERQGKLFCTNLQDRVLIAGKALTYLEGFIHVP